MVCTDRETSDNRGSAERNCVKRDLSRDDRLL